ncbi:MAG TPA: protein kinase [Kofleriaceae bacterium]
MVYHQGVYEPGTVVAGKYRIDRPLGSGGMGIVVAATHLQLGTPIALKFLHPDMMQKDSVVDRFMREARSSAQLRGENVCRVSDVGTEEGQPFIVMELLHGQDLGTVLRTSGSLPVSSAAEIIMQACIALGEAHALGFVHRDIKPGNLFWTQRPDGTALIKVLDFGVAKAPEDINFSLTQTANVMGSPGYMSPEQLKSSKTVDARSDIWSLGIVLYELVSGRMPFCGESITELALRVAMDPLPPLSGGVPPTFESVILRCLEKEPQRRFKDVAELASSLAPFVGPVRGNELAYAVTRVLRGPHVPMVASPPPHATPNTPTTLRGASGVVSSGSRIGPQRSWRLPLVMGGGAVLGVVLALFIVMSKHGKPIAASEPGETQKMEVAPAAPPLQPLAAPAPTPPAAEPSVVETKPAAPVAATKIVNPTKPPAPRIQPKKPTTKAAANKPTATKTAKPIAPKSVAKPKQPAEDVGDSRL